MFVAEWSLQTGEWLLQRGADSGLTKTSGGAWLTTLDLSIIQFAPHSVSLGDDGFDGVLLFSKPKTHMGSSLRVWIYKKHMGGPKVEVVDQRSIIAVGPRHLRC